MKLLVTQSRPTLCDPTDCSPPGSSVHGILWERILEWVAFPFSRGSPQPRDRTRSPALQVDSLPVEPQGKPKNTGVGSLPLLQRIFQTEESNWGLLYCRQILYQPSYQESPNLGLPYFGLILYHLSHWGSWWKFPLAQPVKNLYHRKMKTEIPGNRVIYQGQAAGEGWGREAFRVVRCPSPGFSPTEKRHILLR